MSKQRPYIVHSCIEALLREKRDDADTEQSVFLQALRQGNKVEALQSLRNMIAHLEQSGSSMLITQYQCYDIVNTLIRVLSMSGGDMRRSDLQALNSFLSLDEFYVSVLKINDKP